MTETPAEIPGGRKIRPVQIGNVTISVLEVTEAHLLAMNLRYRSAARRAAGHDPDSDEASRIQYDAVMETFEDALFGLVPDPADQNLAIGELVACRVSPEELMNKLMGVPDDREPSNRSERRAQRGSRRDGRRR